MLTAGFVVLLIMLTISSNRMLMESQETVFEAEAIDIAADLANALMTEASRKKFDENQANYGTNGVNAFTSSSNLGPESGEALSSLPDVAPFQSVSKFDDVDDYNGYTRRVDGQTITGFIVSVKVYYLVSRTNLTQTTSKTMLKRVDVKAEHPNYLPSGFTITRIMTF
ncbi:MAG: hypothetical protein HYY49_08320 [Ignavibacteriales bacterium]|nr:hypothetical protein [Ignavibacteriales bacterium]